MNVAIRRLLLKIENDKVWSAEDLPIDIRVPEHFLFGVKKLLGAWGYNTLNLWVDKNTKSISFGKETILSISVDQLKMKLTYGAFWEEHIGNDADFKMLLKTEQGNLVRSSKGNGKGKEGKAGKLPPSQS